MPETGLNSVHPHRGPISQMGKLWLSEDNDPWSQSWVIQMQVHLTPKYMPTVFLHDAKCQLFLELS